ncbi:MAG: flagellar basal body P-ring formation protein FlgA [bacterium]|nr:flagellar basal body P-ring formation protein FlgA [bacterium]
MKHRIRLAFLLTLVLPASAAWGWTVVLPDSVTVATAVVRLGDLVLEPVPTEAASVLVAEASPGASTALVTRQGVLRRLVALSLADDVRLAGAARCVVRFGGRSLDPGVLQAEAEMVVAALLPPAAPGAPPVSCEVTLPGEGLAVNGAWNLACERSEPLPAGRLQVRLVLTDGWQRRILPATVVVHAHGEVAVARAAIDRGNGLDEGQFEWRWTDLSTVPPGLVSARDQLAGQSAARDLRAGEPLRAADLKPTPVVLAGDTVELRVQRGSVAVSVRALARQAGSLGQTIPVRNELTGRLVNARVAGPGLVEWRR